MSHDSSLLALQLQLQSHAVVWKSFSSLATNMEDDDRDSSNSNFQENHARKDVSTATNESSNVTTITKESSNTTTTTSTAKKHCETCTCDDHNDGSGHERIRNDHYNHHLEWETEDDEVLVLHKARERRQPPHSDYYPCGTPMEREEVLPPALPDPEYSVRRRVLPERLLTALNSSAGYNMLSDCLVQRTAASYIALTEHFANQSDPAFCGVTTLMVVLNSMSVDPNMRWKGGWRYFGDETVLLSQCCLTPERIRRIGITLEEFQQLAVCQGLTVEMKRPFPATNPTNDATKFPSLRVAGAGELSSSTPDDTATANAIPTANAFQASNTTPTTATSTTTTVPAPPPPAVTADNFTGSFHTEDEFRRDIIKHLCGNTSAILVVSFSRAALGQTGDGHFSPLAAYHVDTDQVLLLDVARFKYQPYWVSVTNLYQSLQPLDSTTRLPRGWYVMYPPSYSFSKRKQISAAMKRKKKKSLLDAGPNGTDENSLVSPTISSSPSSSLSSFPATQQYPTVVTEDKRPARLVPLAGKDPIPCPVHTVKVEYCKTSTSSKRH